MCGSYIICIQQQFTLLHCFAQIKHVLPRWSRHCIAAVDLRTPGLLQRGHENNTSPQSHVSAIFCETLEDKHVISASLESLYSWIPVHQLTTVWQNVAEHTTVILLCQFTVEGRQVIPEAFEVVVLLAPSCCKWTQKKTGKYSF